MRAIRPLASALRSSAAPRHARPLSAAAAPAAQQYRAHAEDRLLTHLGRVAAKAHEKGELEESAELYGHLVSARRDRHGDRHPLTICAIGSLSVVAKELGDYHIAEELSREATSVCQAMLGELHPDSLRHASNLASVLAHQGKVDEAKSTALSTLEGYRLLCREGDDDLARAEDFLGAVLHASCSHQQAS